MKPLSLEEVCPEPAEFTLAATGKTYRLRKFSLEDNAWMVKKWGNHLEKVLGGADTVALSQVIFRLLEDKTDFLPREIKDFDDDGNEITVRTTGPEMVRRLIAGKNEAAAAITALTYAFDISKPVVDKTAKLNTEIKEEESKKNSSAGVMSLTESPHSTDTALIKSVG